MPAASGYTALVRTNQVHRASSAATGNHTTTSEATGTNDAITIALDVTAVSGTTPTMDVEVQWSPNTVDWYTEDSGADRFAQRTATGKVIKTFPVRAMYFRLNVTIAGTTPSFTYRATTFKGFVAP